MSLDQQAIDREWASQFVSQYIDADSQPSTCMIALRGWSALVCADILNWMEAEWLAEAIGATSPGTVCGIGFEYQLPPDMVVLAPDPKALMEFHTRNSWRYAVLTSPDVGFLHFKDQANRFSLLCGPPGFVAQAYRCSWDTARKMYFDDWVDLEHNSPDEQRFLTGVWEKYSSFQ